jgi:hypothetical protein
VTVWLRRFVDAISEWPLQDELYTVKERFRYRPFLGFVSVPTEWDRSTMESQSICSYSNQEGSPAPQHGKDGLMEIDLTDVSAFATEDYMPPQTDYKPSVICYYGGREFASSNQFWITWQQRISKWNEEWLGKSSSLREAAAQIIGAETEPEKKLRKLYDRVQQLRNLSFERDRSAQEEKKEKLKPAENPKEVLQHGYGTHWELDALFAALARAAGFDASLVATNDRDARTFSPMILWFGQLDGKAVLVEFNGKELMLDPGSRFLPFGTLDWRHSGAPGLSFKPGAAFVTTPDAQTSQLHRSAQLQIAEDGSAQGEITLEFQGQDAFVRRLEALNTDEAGRRKSLEDEVLAWFPSGSEVKLLESRGWDSTDDPLVARLHIEAPQFGAMAGKRLVAPQFIFPPPFKSVFSASSRNYPIVFPYPFSENDEVTLQFPAGYMLESSPLPRKAGLSYAGYEVTSAVEGNKVTTSRKFRLDEYSFEREKFSELQNFFNVVQGGDTAQLVLRPEPAQTAAQ